MKQQGVTIIEMMIVLAIVGIVFALLLNTSAGLVDNTVSFGINGFTETRCIDGYKFVVGHDGQARQVMSEFGHGVKCQ